MEGSRRVAVYSHRANTSPSDYSPLGIATHLMCLGDYYFAKGVDHLKLELVIDLESLRLGHLARYPIGLLRRFFLYAWVSIVHVYVLRTILLRLVSY